MNAATETEMIFIDPQAALPEGALLLDNNADVLAQPEHIRRHAVVALQFPKWTDGRAYSQAVLLRGRLRYTGEIRATGDVLADMLPLLRRTGFSTVQLRADQALEVAQHALGYFDGYYQAAPAERVSAEANAGGSAGVAR